MRSAIAVAAGVLALSLVQPAAAQTFGANPDLFGQKKPSPKPPPVDWNWRPPVQAPRSAAPTVLCGMTVIQADPTIDPKIASKPQQTGTHYTLKVVEPTVCKTP